MNTFFDLLGDLAKAALAGDPYAPDPKQVEERRAYVEQQKLNMALPCRQCRKLAEPILGTMNRYRCSCGNQFAAAKHHL